MIIVVGLVGFGLVMVYSASEALGFLWYNDPNYFFAHQLIGAALGGVGLVVAARLDYHRLSRLARPAMCGDAGAARRGADPARRVAQHFGAQRWFQFGPLSVQPSAIAVGVAIVFFSRWLTDREGSVRSLRGVRDYIIVLVAAARPRPRRARLRQLDRHRHDGADPACPGRARGSATSS